MSVALPTEDKARRGFPGHHPRNTREPKPPKLPKPPKTLPEYPEHMPFEGRQTWYEVGAHLLEFGFITTTDVRALIDYVELDILNTKLTILLRNQSPVLDEGTVASTKKNPLWMLKLEYLRERRAQHIQFGMTPSARSKIVSALDDEDPLESALT